MAVNVASGALAGSTLDLNFALNAGSCALYRIAISCSELLTTTRAQTVPSYAQWADGHFSSFSANTLRNTDRGALIENGSTNLALWSNDLTNAAYTKVNVTAAMDQTGPDQIANSASSATATANGGTVLQLLTSSASSRTLSVWLLRITGVGAVTLTENGLTGTACTLSTSVWTQCTLTASVLNPTLGLIFATSGDKVAVWDVQFEAQAWASSPIPTTTVSVARNLDVVSINAIGLPAAYAASSAYVLVGSIPSFSQIMRAVSFSGGCQLRINSTTVSASPGVASGTVTGIGTGLRAAYGFDVAGSTAIGNGSTLGTSATTCTPQTGSVFVGNLDGTTPRTSNTYLMRLVLGIPKSRYDYLAK